ncbi:MAG: arylsulfatase, partial [Anaerolineae bacterium]|nr:arylsulfatase [Anaerolineae bacterium]
RRELVTEGTQARIVLRQGNWTFIPPHDGPAVAAHTNIETGNSPEPQLYDLSLDIGQITNLATANRARADEMAARLTEVFGGERTRPARRGA